MVDSESDDLTGKQVHNSTDISKASGYSDISNITHPNLIRLRRIEPLLQVVNTFDDVLAEFKHKQPRFAERIAERGLPEPPVPKQKKTEAEKLAIKRMRRKNKKKKEKERLESSRVNPDQDDRFFFIAGYTSGSAPYGVTWEEMGLAPYEDLCDPNAED